MFVPDSEANQVRELHRMMESGQAELIGPNGQSKTIPSDVYTLLENVLNLLNQGLAVSILPYNKALTTQEAADILNISRQHLVRLLDRGDLAHHMVGTHRRVKLHDLIAYQQERDKARHQAIVDVAKEAIADESY